MRDPIFDSVPGSRRYRSEVEAQRRRAARRAEQTPDDAAVRGALDAARWTLAETPEPPLSASGPPSRANVEAELDLARAVFLGLVEGDRERAAGVREWLEWWL